MTKESFKQRIINPLAEMPMAVKVVMAIIVGSAFYKGLIDIITLDPFCHQKPLYISIPYALFVLFSFLFFYFYLIHEGDLFRCKSLKEAWQNYKKSFKRK